MQTFAAFNLSKKLVDAAAKLGYVNPSPVQEKVIPKTLSGKNIVCQSVTGSGKTHAYLLPIIDTIDMDLPRLQSLILVPSRELGRQVYEFATAFGKYFPKLKIRLFTSESEKAQNLEGMTIPPHIFIATPGRAKDLLVDSSTLALHGVRHFVLDEADMLMELGYFDDIDAIFSSLPEKVQTMVFSATLNQGLKDRLEKYIGSEFNFEGEKDKTASTVSHHLVDIRHVGTLAALSSFLAIRKPYLAIIFASKKEDVKKTYDYLREQGEKAVLFSGDLTDRERKKTIRLIKENQYPIIVASDLLSRGIDIEDVSDVISLDLPSDLSYYYHRAGRSGRYGKTGDSWVFYNADDVRRAKALISQGVNFDFYTLKEGGLKPESGSLKEKKRPNKKPDISDEQKRDISIAKARTKVDKVVPGYKAKRKKAIEKVNGKYRRAAIKKKVREETSKSYRDKSKAKKK